MTKIIDDEIVAATETDGGIGEEVEVAEEFEELKDGE